MAPVHAKRHKDEDGSFGTQLNIRYGIKYMVLYLNVFKYKYEVFIVFKYIWVQILYMWWVSNTNTFEKYLILSNTNFINSYEFGGRYCHRKFSSFLCFFCMFLRICSYETYKMIHCMPLFSGLPRLTTCHVNRTFVAWSGNNLLSKFA